MTAAAPATLPLPSADSLIVLGPYPTLLQSSGASSSVPPSWLMHAVPPLLVQGEELLDLSSCSGLSEKTRLSLLHDYAKHMGQTQYDCAMQNAAKDEKGAALETAERTWIEKAAPWLASATPGQGMTRDIPNTQLQLADGSPLSVRWGDFKSCGTYSAFLNAIIDVETRPPDATFTFNSTLPNPKHRGQLSSINPYGSVQVTDAGAKVALAYALDQLQRECGSQSSRPDSFSTVARQYGHRRALADRLAVSISSRLGTLRIILPLQRARDERKRQLVESTLQSAAADLLSYAFDGKPNPIISLAPGSVLDMRESVSQAQERMAAASGLSAK